VGNRGAKLLSLARLTPINRPVRGIDLRERQCAQVHSICLCVTTPARGSIAPQLHIELYGGALTLDER